MMQESGTEAASNVSASHNGASSGNHYLDSITREGRSNGDISSIEVTAAELVHLQQQQVYISCLGFSLDTASNFCLSVHTQVAA